VLYAWLQRFHDKIDRDNDILKRLGQDPDPVPPMPARRSDGARADFLKRTAEHDARLVEYLGEKVAKQPPPGTGGTAP
jgi:Ser/Thr protein kinase RdoA (MazF antagonist)